MTRIQIRQATNKDNQEIIELVKSILDEFNLVYSPESSEQDLLDIEATYTRNGGLFTVIVNQASNIIGTIALLKLDNNTCKLRKMYVAQSCRSQGIGKLLLTHMIERARQLGFSQIILETVHSMEVAIRLYENSGFTRIARQAASPRCDIVMKLEFTYTSGTLEQYKDDKV